MTGQKLLACVISDPWVEYESPMTLVFEADIKGDKIPVKFIGDKARALKYMIKKGDTIMITVGFMKNGWLATDHCTIDKSTAIGRNVNLYA
jgi:hypothetical protein